jgi:hypothetical protein
LYYIFVLGFFVVSFVALLYSVARRVNEACGWSLLCVNVEGAARATNLLVASHVPAIRNEFHGPFLLRFLPGFSAQKIT